MKYSSDKDVNQLVQGMVRDGWHFEWGKKHGKLFTPKRNRFVVIPTSPSHKRAVMELRAVVRRALQ